MHEEALVRGLARRIAVSEGLERALALVACLADRGQEQRLLDEHGRAAAQIGAGDQNGVIGGRARRQASAARGNNDAGPYCIEPSTRPSSS